MPLIFAGLAVGVAFRGGLFNIGVQRQLIMGAIAVGFIRFTWHLPPVLHLLVATPEAAVLLLDEDQR